MVVDTKHGAFIIADEGIGNGGDGSKATLIVVDMKTGKTRRLHEGTRTIFPDTDMPTVINGKTLAVDGNPLIVGCDDGFLGDDFLRPKIDNFKCWIYDKYLLAFHNAFGYYRTFSILYVHKDYPQVLSGLRPYHDNADWNPADHQY